MATTEAYTATGINFQIKQDTADVSKVRRTFLHSRKSFCRVQIHSTAAVLVPAVVISFQSVKESLY